MTEENKTKVNSLIDELSRLLRRLENIMEDEEDSWARMKGLGRTERGERVLDSYFKLEHSCSYVDEAIGGLNRALGKKEFVYFRRKMSERKWEWENEFERKWEYEEDHETFECSYPNGQCIYVRTDGGAQAALKAALAYPYREYSPNEISIEKLDESPEPTAYTMWCPWGVLIFA